MPPAVQNAILAFADQTAHVAREAVAAQLLEYQQHADILAEDNERLAANVVKRDEALMSATANMTELDRKIARLESELASARAQIVQERDAVQQATTSLAKLEQRLEVGENTQDELRLLREECARERNVRVESELALAEMRVQKALHEQRVQDLAASLTSARAACQKLEARNSELDAHLKCAERELADAQRELAVQCAVGVRSAGRKSKTAMAGLQGALGLDGDGLGNAPG